MNTQNAIIFPNYKPEISNNMSTTTVETYDKEHIIAQTWHEAFLILHDYEPETKIKKFLNKIKSKYQDQLETSEYFKAMNKYNLVDIFNEIHDNLYYVWNNQSQLELIEKFNISSFERLYQIVDTIWMWHSLHWKHIAMPVDKFSLLTQYIEHYHTKYFTQEDYLLMAKDLEYHNLEWLYSGLSALNMAESISRIDFNYTDTVNILMFTHQYITKNKGADENVTTSDLKIIYENYYDDAIKSKKHSYSSVKRLLTLFGYKIEDDQFYLKAA